MSARIPTPAGWQADLAAAAEQTFARARRLPWPSLRFENNVVGFARDVVGYQPFDGPAGQVQWMQPMCREGVSGSVVGAHKLGKTMGFGTLALHAWATYPEVRVILFAPKIDHINEVLWPEIYKQFMAAGRCEWCRSGVCGVCHADEHMRGGYCPACENRGISNDPCVWCSPIGDMSWISRDDSTKGLRSPDRRREIFAYTSSNKDSKGGLSGPRMRFLLEEAGGIKQEMIDALRGNSAGGVSWWQNGNPLHLTGHLFDAHHSKRDQYDVVVELDARKSPNVLAGKMLIPGVAGPKWVAKRKADWGENSSLYQMRVCGQWPKYQRGQLLRADEVTDSMGRSCRFEGRLQAGLDVAFYGDRAKLAARRGRHIQPLKVYGHMEPEALAHAVAADLAELRAPHERKPLLVFDRQGDTGAKFARAIEPYEDELEIVGVVGTAPPRDAQRFRYRRDELLCGLGAWVRHQRGQLPRDTLLEAEIAITVGRPVSKRDRRIMYPANDDIRAELGRSPDARDACALACANVEGSDGLGDAGQSAAAAEQTQGGGEPPRRHPPRRQARQRDREQQRRQFRYGAADAGMAAAWGRS